MWNYDKSIGFDIDFLFKVVASDFHTKNRKVENKNNVYKPLSSDHCA